MSSAKLAPTGARTSNARRTPPTWLVTHALVAVIAGALGATLATIFWEDAPTKSERELLVEAFLPLDDAFIEGDAALSLGGKEAMAALHRIRSIIGRMSHGQLSDDHRNMLFVYKFAADEFEKAVEEKVVEQPPYGGVKAWAFRAALQVAREDLLGKQPDNLLPASLQDDDEAEAP